MKSSSGEEKYKKELLESWKYTSDEWDSLSLWRYVNYKSHAVLIKDAIWLQENKKKWQQEKN